MAYFDVDRRGNTLPHSGSYGAPPSEKATGEYIVSGLPFVSGSAETDTSVYQYNFPRLTQWVLVSNESDTDMKIGFTAAGVADDQYFTVQASQMTDKLEVRTKAMFIKSGGSNKAYSIMAGLTDIPTGSIGEFSSNNVYWGT